VRGNAGNDIIAANGRAGRRRDHGIFGVCGIVGATKEGTEVAFNVNDVMLPGRRIVGIVQGDVVAQIFIPTLIELYRQGRFPFDRLVRFYRFDEINQAMADSESGVTIRPILKMDQK
jgi:aryl-alcohol dehydrogenase